MSTAGPDTSADQGRTQRVGPPQAVLWDMDGTLVDTEPYWIATEYAMAEKYSATWSHEHAMKLVGNDLLESGAYIKAHMGLAQSPAEVVEELLDGVVARVNESVPWRPGARDLLGELQARGVRCALVTMSWTRFVEPILADLGHDVFEVVVTGDRVERGKPHPDPYLLAAAELGLDPADCLAVEDSSTGASSAQAAGCGLLVVPHYVQVPTAPGRVFRDTLVGLTPDDLGAVLTESAAGR